MHLCALCCTKASRWSEVAKDREACQRCQWLKGGKMFTKIAKQFRHNAQNDIWHKQKDLGLDSLDSIWHNSQYYNVHEIPKTLYWTTIHIHHWHSFSLNYDEISVWCQYICKVMKLYKECTCNLICLLWLWIYVPSLSKGPGMCTLAHPHEVKM